MYTYMYSSVGVYMCVYYACMYICMFVCIVHALNIVTNVVYSLLPFPLFAYRAISVCVHVCVGRACLSLYVCVCVCVCVCVSHLTKLLYVRAHSALYVRAYVA